MPHSDDPWAMAMTLTRCSPKALKIRPAMPGVVWMPAPTMVTMATASRSQTRSMSRRCNSAANSASSPATTAGADASGTIKVMDCSEDA